MNTCKYCGKPLMLTPEYDTCMECQGEQHKTFTLPINNNTISNKTEMTPKKNIINIETYLTTYRLQDSPSWLEIKQALAEHEELKRDVKRFMELMDKYMTFVFLCDEETNDEYDELSKKLMKVGK